MSPVRRRRRPAGGNSGRHRRRRIALLGLPRLLARRVRSLLTVPSRWRRGRRALALALLALAAVVGASSASSAILPRPEEPAGTDGAAAMPADPSWPYQGLPAAPYLPPAAPPSGGTATPSSQPPVPGASDAAVAVALAGNGIPLVALTAYRNAERRLAVDRPACGLTWSLLAAIGRVESNHGRFAGAQLLQDGRSSPPIVGVALDGHANFATIRDTDGGKLDGLTTFDRAIGPMQFIPSTWRMYAVDGDGDRRTDPYNINDAALGAGAYLCEAGGNLRTPAGLRAAVFSYNHSADYVQLVLDLKAEYERGVPIDRLPPGKARGGTLPKPHKAPLPPVNPSPPPAVDPGPSPSSTTPAPSGAPTTGLPTTTVAPGPTAPSTTPPETGTPTPSPTCPTPTPTPSPSPTPTSTPGPCDPTPTPTETATPASATTTDPSPSPNPPPPSP